MRLTAAAFRAMLFGASALFGCADEPGHGFATLESASVQVSLEPGEARAIDGAILTNRAYRVTVTRLEIDVESVALTSLSGGNGSARFDPSNPPPGYGTCHGGHCHHEDGRLVDYADIEAELAAGSGGGFTEVARAEVGQRLDALAAERKRVSEFAPSRELPETELRKVSVGLSALRVDAEVSSGDDTTSPRRLVVRVPLELSLEEGVDLRIDRDGPAVLRLAVVLRLDGTLFDDIEFDELDAALRDAGVATVLEVSDPEDSLALQLATALLASELEVRFDG